MVTRRDCLALLLAAPMAISCAQAKSPAVGILFFGQLTTPVQDAFRQGLRDHGRVEGRNIRIEWRAAEGRADLAKAHAEDLVRLKVDVILANLTPSVHAAKGATSAIPIVMAPAGSGIVSNLARPEGNVTGISGFSAELSGKRLQVAHELLPELRQIVLLLNAADPGFAKTMLAETEAAARQRGLAVRPVTIGSVAEIDAALAALAKDPRVAVLVQPSLVVSRARAREVAQIGLRHRVAMGSASAEFTESGGLFSFGANFLQIYRYAGMYVDKLLKGAKPSDLPVERASQLELVVNGGTATALGIRVPPALLQRADRVLE